MRCGVTLYMQGYQDWDRYEADETGAGAQPLDPEADRTRWVEELDSALKIEDQGFDSLWVVEHHISPYTMTTNPLQLLSYFAGTTSKIDVGTMIVVLPWHHPLRVAEDMTMLQYLLQGRRAFIGVGRGAGRREFRQLGFDMNESKERFSEAIQIIQKAVREEKFSFEGVHWKFEDITMRPRPLNPEQLLDDMHFSWGSPTSAEIGGQYGLRPLIIPQRAWSDYHDELAAFNQARREHGFGPSRPRLHLNVFCGENEAKAEEQAKQFIPEYVDSAARNYELFGNHFATTKGYEHYAQVSQAAGTRDDLIKGMSQTYLNNHIWGTPDQCLAKMQAIAEQFHPEEWMLVMRYGSMPKEVADKSTDLFAREVLPAIHEMPTLEPIDYA